APARRVPRADRAAGGALREGGPPPPLRRIALADRGARPHSRHVGHAEARRRALVTRVTLEGTMIIRKSPEEIDKIAAAGRVPARCHTLLAGKARPGVTTAELDEAAEKFIRSQGGEPAFKGYRGFPGSICASPNSMVVHGIPGPYKLGRGDTLSIDVGVVLDGWVSDAAITVPIGPVTPIATNLMQTTRDALFEAVEQARPGNHL